MGWGPDWKVGSTGCSILLFSQHGARVGCIVSCICIYILTFLQSISVPLFLFSSFFFLLHRATIWCSLVAIWCETGSGVQLHKKPSCDKHPTVGWNWVWFESRCLFEKKTKKNNKIRNKGPSVHPKPGEGQRIVYLKSRR